MNKCKACDKETKNKIQCSFDCRDKGRKLVTHEVRTCKVCGNYKYAWESDTK